MSGDRMTKFTKLSLIMLVPITHLFSSNAQALKKLALNLTLNLLKMRLPKKMIATLMTLIISA